MAAAATQQAEYATLKNHLYHCLRLGEVHGTNVSMAYDSCRRREWARLVDIGVTDWSMAEEAVKTDEDTLDEALAECGVSKPRDGGRGKGAADKDGANKGKPQKEKEITKKKCNFCKKPGHVEANCFDKNPALKKEKDDKANKGAGKKRRKGVATSLVSDLACSQPWY